MTRKRPLDLAPREHGGRLVQDEERASKARALQISTSCFWAAREPLDAVLGRHAGAELGQELRGPRPHRGPGRGCRPAPSSSAPRKTFSSTDRSAARLNSWGTMLTPARRASEGDGRTTGRPPISSVPGGRLVDAGQDLHEGRLAGAVLADEPEDLAAPDLGVHVAEHGVPAELLPERPRADQGTACHRGSPRGRKGSIDSTERYAESTDTFDHRTNAWWPRWGRVRKGDRPPGTVARPAEADAPSRARPTRDGSRTLVLDCAGSRRSRAVAAGRAGPQARGPAPRSRRSSSTRSRKAVTLRGGWREAGLTMWR